MQGPFDAFQRELKRIHALSAEGIKSSGENAGTTFPFDAISLGAEALTHPLASTIVHLRVRRFTNRFISVMLSEVGSRPGRKDYAAARITFDVALLSYLYHVVLQDGAMKMPATTLLMLGKALLRKVRGKDGFIDAEVEQRLDRYALPRILKTIAAYLHASSEQGYVKSAECQRLLSHYRAKSALEFRALKPAPPHPLASHSIFECLADRAGPKTFDYFNPEYQIRICEGTGWNVGLTLNTYWSSPFTLADG